MSILHELEWRGLIADCTDRSALEERLGHGSITVYCGFDPTAESLHVGSLVPLLALRRFQLAGHQTIPLAGGATGLIGDPSGKTAERQLLNREALDANISGIKAQLRQLLDFENVSHPARLLDNASWTETISYLEFLRDVGKHFTINMMVAKESVRARMEDRESGISYTEFSYMLLQAFDFYVLCRDQNCDLQIGGSDQWGNITAGIDLCRKKLNRTVYGLTLPLITNADGSKFGKSVSGAVWLDAGRTSVYRFYQFWIRSDDRDVIRYLKYFTFLSKEQIDELERDHLAHPESRAAHKVLAREVTTMLHGAEATAEAVKASEILFGGDLAGISEKTFAELIGEIPTKQISASLFQGNDGGLPLVEALVQAGLASSKGQARKDIEGGGIYLNNRRVAEAARVLKPSDLLFGKQMLLRKGKRNYAVMSLA